MGFFADSRLCIGCKACEIACKQWNQLPASDPVWTGSSYDNTGQLSATTWRHVQFIEHIGRRDNGRNAYIDDQIAQAQLEGTIPLIPPGQRFPFSITVARSVRAMWANPATHAPGRKHVPPRPLVTTGFV